MPRLEKICLKIRTGAQGLDALPKYSINGFPLEFDETKGGTGAGETLEATGHPQSFPHTLLLSGAGRGAWDIEEFEATYHCARMEPYTVRLAPISLDHDADLNIWYEPPPKVIDV